MSNEEKLRVLLQIAVENGWEDELDFQYNLSFSNSIVKNKYIFEDCGGSGELHSINDLVTNWERDEVSFIEALCRGLIDNYNFDSFNLIFNSGREVWINKAEDLTCDIVREYWSNVPTSQRLEELFKIFKTLII